jgi:outer membrane protein assembly factor BamD (BamD/ComL family)
MSLTSLRSRACPTAALIAGVLLAQSPASAAAATRTKAEKPQQAVVMWDDTRLKAKPVVTDETVATANCGDMVTLTGRRYKDWLRVKGGSAEGWLTERNVVSLHAPGAAARLLVAARDIEEPPPSRYGQPPLLNALALYSRFLQFFPNSEYEAFTLYRYGQVADRLAAEARRKADQELSPEEKRSDTGLMSWNGLDEYKKWGLNFSLDHLGGEYRYDGQVYARILKDHPRSPWADNAAYALLKLSRADEWEGFPDGPLAELPKWQAFLRKYPASELAPKVLLEIGYLDRVLHEVHSHEKNFVSPAKANKYRRAAIDVFGKIRRQFPGTEFAARAEKNLAELSEGRNVYLMLPYSALHHSVPR